MRTFVHFAKAISLLIYVGSTIGAGDIVQLVSGLLQKIAQQRSVEHACCVCNNPCVNYFLYGSMHTGILGTSC